MLLPVETLDRGLEPSLLFWTASGALASVFSRGLRGLPPALAPALACALGGSLLGVYCSQLERAQTLKLQRERDRLVKRRMMAL